MAKTLFKNSRKGDINDYYTIEDGELGRGASSVVKKGRHKGTNNEYAIKIITRTVDQKIIATEIDILLHMKQHCNIIQLHEIFETPSHIYMVLEFVEGGELFERIVERGYYSEKDAADAVRQICDALAYIHKHKIIHRDLKPENLLYANKKEDSALKIADFGLSKMLYGEQCNTATVCGTPGYCAPEVLKGNPYDTKVDMWAVGVIAYILECGRLLLEDGCGFIGAINNEFSGNGNISIISGKAAKRDKMDQKFFDKLNEFNARRKLKGGMIGIMALTSAFKSK
ncbi:calcium/calmodulin-dependent protein kinase type IV-like [Stylophora pistillata]|nr:calcium/calmodulin-dependent protein kinase type IV-like [Stylophora pistillata]